MNKEKPNQEIKVLIRQLQQLQLQQQLITQRLATLTTTNRSQSVRTATVPRVATPEPNEPEKFRIGDKVRILNPRAHQQNIGFITNIGKTNITVTATDGLKIVRAPHNLKHNE